MKEFQTKFGKVFGAVNAFGTVVIDTDGQCTLLVSKIKYSARYTEQANVEAHLSIQRESKGQVSDSVAKKLRAEFKKLAALIRTPEAVQAEVNKSYRWEIQNNDNDIKGLYAKIAELRQRNLELSKLLKS